MIFSFPIFPSYHRTESVWWCEWAQFEETIITTDFLFELGVVLPIVASWLGSTETSCFYRFVPDSVRAPPPILLNYSASVRISRAMSTLQFYCSILSVRNTPKVPRLEFGPAPAHTCRENGTRNRVIWPLRKSSQTSADYWAEWYPRKIKSADLLEYDTAPGITAVV